MIRVSTALKAPSVSSPKPASSTMANSITSVRPVF
jgi:hypothetical protein